MGWYQRENKEKASRPRASISLRFLTILKYDQLPQAPPAIDGLNYELSKTYSSLGCFGPVLYFFFVAMRELIKLYSFILLNNFYCKGHLILLNVFVTSEMIIRFSYLFCQYGISHALICSCLFTLI